MIWTMMAVGLLGSVFAVGQAHAQTVTSPAPFASFDRASEPVLRDPHDLTLGPDGRLYVADKFGDRIVVMDPDTLEVLETFGDGRLANVHDISFAADGTAWIAVTGYSELVGFRNSVGGWVETAVFPGLSRTEGTLAHSNGRLYAVASGSGDVVAYENGKPIAAVSGHVGAHDVAEAPDGTIWLADTGNRRLVQYSPDLEPLKIISGPDYAFVGPRYLDIDKAGRLIVADQEGHRILLIDPFSGENGRLIGVLGTGTPGEGPNLFDDPEGVAVDGATYYFSDSDNNRIVRYITVTN